jgi:uncharacterized protein YlxW (UPF0749 family)
MDVVENKWREVRKEIDSIKGQQNELNDTIRGYEKDIKNIPKTVTRKREVTEGGGFLFINWSTTKVIDGKVCQI